MTVTLVDGRGKWRDSCWKAKKLLMAQPLARPTSHRWRSISWLTKLGANFKILSGSVATNFGVHWLQPSGQSTPNNWSNIVFFGKVGCWYRPWWTPFVSLNLFSCSRAWRQLGKHGLLKVTLAFSPRIIFSIHSSKQTAENSDFLLLLLLLLTQTDLFGWILFHNFFWNGAFKKIHTYTELLVYSCQRYKAAVPS